MISKIFIICLSIGLAGGIIGSLLQIVINRYEEIQRDSECEK